MKTMTDSAAWALLQQRGLVTGNMPTDDAPETPWFVRVMLGIAGWMGAGFFLMFFGLIFSALLDAALALLVLGALCCALASVLLRVGRNSDFLGQAGLSISLCGQLMVMFGLFKLFDQRDAAMLLCLTAFELLLVFLVANFIHRMMCMLAAALAFAFALERLGLHGVANALVAAAFVAVWLEPARWAVRRDFWGPVGYGLVAALLCLALLRLSGFYHLLAAGKTPWMLPQVYALAPVLMAAVCLWTGLRLLARESIRPASATGASVLVALLLVAILSLYASGLATASLVLLVGFACGNRLLAGAGILALLFFLAHYYYQLDLTLLAKSGVLLASGVVLLLARLVLQRCFPAGAVEEDAR